MADFVAEVGCLGWIAVGLRPRTGFDLTGLEAFYATPTLRSTLHRIWRAAGQPAMRATASLSCGSKNKLVLGASQSKPTEFRMRFKCANRIAIFLR
jgi:hypothetical protein